MPRFFRLLLLTTMSVLVTNCGKNDAKRPALTPGGGLEAKPVQENLPILGTWVSCIPISDPLLSKPYGSLVAITFLQSGKASRETKIYEDGNCRGEFTDAGKEEGVYAATIADDKGVGSLDVRISSGQKVIRRFDSYEISEGRLAITNSQECEADCESVPGGSPENRNRDFSDAITFDRVVAQ